jgi:hypothetical protein
VRKKDERGKRRSACRSSDEEEARERERERERERGGGEIGTRGAEYGACVARSVHSSGMRSIDAGILHIRGCRSTSYALRCQPCRLRAGP